MFAVTTFLSSVSRLARNEAAGVNLSLSQQPISELEQSAMATLVYEVIS
jgi:hypothetical protein